MIGNTIVFETDERQKYLAEYLPGKKQEIFWQSVQIPFLVEKMQQADCIVLPTPASKMDQIPILHEMFAEYLTNWEGYVFGGKIGENWSQLFENNEITYYDFLKNEVVALENAQLTAEATVSIILAKGLYRIKDQKVVITGYGRCARELAGILAKLGANITILARSVVARKRAKEEGYSALDFAYGPEEICGADTVINTVPSYVITEAMLKELHEDTLFIDIASLPGGVSLELKEKYPHTIYHELSLPGRYIAKSSGKVFADMILRTKPSLTKISKRKDARLAMELERGKECPWILQILL